MKKQVHAKILYDDILSDSAGFYVWLQPDEKAVIDITRLLRSAPFKTNNSTELHCTLIHCTTNLPVELNAPEDKAMKARIVEVVHWIDHKGRHILVLLLESNALSKAHQCMVEQGIQHSHEEFNPHISIAKAIDWNAEARIWVDDINKNLSNTPMIIRFDPIIKASSAS